MWSSFSVFCILSLTLVSARNPFAPSQIKSMVVFGDSYSVQNVGDGRVQWADWVASPDYANLALFDFAQSGATCSQALTPRTFPAIMQNELPAFLQQQKNGTLPHLDPLRTIYAIWIGTNDVGAGCLLTGEQTPGVTLVDTTSCVIDLVRTLYQNGGRNFLFLNMVPLERAPMYQVGAYPSKYYLAAKNATDWNVSMRELTVAGNALLKFMFTGLSNELTAAHIGIFDSHGLLNDVINHPAQYLNGTIPFNVTGCANPCVYGVNGVGPVTCTLATGGAVDSYVWYNELHLSNQANRVVAREVTAAIRGKENKWTTWL